MVIVMGFVFLMRWSSGLVWEFELKEGFEDLPMFHEEKIWWEVAV